MKSTNIVSNPDQDLSWDNEIWDNDFLFEKYPDAILIVDESGKIAGANRNLSDMFGYKKHEMFGKAVEMLLPKPMRKPHVKKRNNYIKNSITNDGRPMETGVAFQARRKDGSCFPIDIMLSSATGKGGKVIVTVIRDISKKIAAEENERQAKEALKAVFDAAPVAIYSVGRDRKILSWSRAAEKLFGATAEEVIGKVCDDNSCAVGKSDKGLDLFELIFSGKTIRNYMSYRQHKNGQIFPVSLDAAPMFDEDGKIYAITYSAQDISERLESEDRERKANDTLKAVVNSAPVAIIVLDIEKNILSWSKEAENLFGFSAEEVLGKPYALIPPGDSTSEMDKVFEGKTVKDIQRYRLRKDGSRVAVTISAAPIFLPNGEIKSAAYCVQDITERLASEAKLNKLAYVDYLTSLPNRASLKRHICESIEGTTKFSGKILFVAKFRIKGFLEINNALGHDSGQKLLIEIAARMRRFSPDNALVYRTGRYNFALAVFNISDPKLIMDIVNPLLERMSMSYEIDKQPVHLEINAGVAIGPAHGDEAEELLANANLALSAARVDVSRNVRLFDMSMKAKIQVKRQLDIDLRRAYEEGEFELFYQPQIRLFDNRLVGAEALLRWRLPGQGVVQPGVFIDALANTPIAYDVGKWVLQSALMQVASWKTQGLDGLRMGVNLFAAQFDNETLVGDVESALEFSGLDANVLELEITENIAIGMKKSIIEPLKTLRAKGVGIAFDDFGTGYASLSYLVKYPLTRLKIDKSFIDNVPQSEEEVAIVQATIVMAHKLGLEVIAEGVETLAHEEFLRQENCEEVQGYFYSKPMPAAEFFEFAKDFSFKKAQTTAAITPITYVA